jgi:DNA-binding NtrC family response regulator
VVIPPRHVLLVDDDADLRTALRRRLERLGCRVTEARDGAEAIRCHQADAADVLLTDLIMPGKEGVETIAEFQQSYPSVRRVAMSGGGVVPAGVYLQMAEGFGATEVLQKPFSVAELSRAIGVEPRPGEGDG